MTQAESFPRHLNRQTMWWPALVVFSFYVLTEVGFWFVLILGLPWLAFKFTKWKKLANQEASDSEFRVIRLDQKTLLIAIGLAAIPAYVVSSIGPDHRAFYQELPYQAAREMGYSPSQARQMRSQVLSMVDEPKGPFRTLTGWFWFLVLGGLYTWRIYLFFFLRSSRTESALIESREGLEIHQDGSAIPAEHLSIPDVDKFCVQCGKPARPEENFCGGCGYKH